MTIAFLFDCLWQGAIVTAIAACTVRFFARSAPTRYAVWFLALCALVAVPAFTLLVPVHLPTFSQAQPSDVAMRIRMTLVSVESAGGSAAPTFAIVTLWIVGAALMLLRLALSAARIEQIRRKSVPAIVGSHAVLVSDEIVTPIAAGAFHPVVILPGDITERLSSSDLLRVIAHERAHIDRNDVAANYLQRLIEAALFFNPFVHVIGNRLVHEREAACDDLAVSVTGETHDYAACLANLAQTVARRSAPLVSPSVFGSRRALVERIERLLSDDTLRAVRPNYPTIVATALAFAFIAVAIEPLAPVIASPAAVSTQAVASACGTADSSAAVTNPMPPDLPKGVHPKQPTLLRVSISPTGIPTRVMIQQSSGDSNADLAAAQAATHSTYKPAIHNCKSVAGTYIFRVEYAPIDQLPPH